MNSCTFFGHRDTPESVKPFLRAAITKLIEEKDVRLYYVGSQGNFDKMAQSQLNELSKIYPIQYYVVLAYMPKKEAFAETVQTIYPEGLETVPKRYAISKRNRWMLQQSQTVITYVRNDIGGAAQFKEMAQKMGKIMICL